MKAHLRRIFYDVETGDKLVDTGLKISTAPQTTLDYDISVYKVLSERNRETFDVLELEPEEYAADFAEGRLVGVDRETKELRFEYPNPENPEESIIPEKPFSKQLEEVRNSMDSAILELTMLIAMGGMTDV